MITNSSCDALLDAARQNAMIDGFALCLFVVVVITISYRIFVKIRG
jgi:hypothetical protein